jgi:hypothetical protein
MRGRIQVIKTYRYVRLAMVGLLMAIAISVLLVYLDVRDWETSVSAYYYTPARGIFVGALVALGVAMIALRGNSDIEEFLLNLGGLCAPIVGLVPTRRDVPEALAKSIRDDVINNVQTYLILGAVAVVLTVVLALWERSRANEPRKPAVKPSGWDTLGMIVSGTLLLAVGGWMAIDTNSFIAHAHIAAATLLIVCVGFAVVSNTKLGLRLPGESDRSANDDKYNKYSKYYGTVAILMVLTQGLWFVDWDENFLVIEVVMMLLFAAFWLIQTWDLRDTDLERVPLDSTVMA